MISRGSLNQRQPGLERWETCCVAPYSPALRECLESFSHKTFLSILAAGIMSCWTQLDHSPWSDLALVGCSLLPKEACFLPFFPQSGGLVDTLGIFGLGVMECSPVQVHGHDPEHAISKHIRLVRADCTLHLRRRHGKGPLGGRAMTFLSFRIR